MNNRSQKRGRTASWLSAAAVATALTMTISGCGAANEQGSTNGDGLSGTLNGAGASSQEAAVAAWSQGFQTANPDATVNYDPVGSGSGREQFLAGGVAFAGSDAPLTDEELAAGKQHCGGDVVELPTYVSPIAVVYNVDGVTELNMSAPVLGEIFAGKITRWDDAKIKAENPDATLPSLDITPVHRSDDSGTTANFTDYLAATSNGTWSKGSVESWPYQSGEGAEGTSGVVSAVKTGSGTIGYADASQAGDLGIAKLKVGDTYVEYSPKAAALALDASTPIEGRGENSVVFELDRTTTKAGAYPLILVSYQLACAKYEDADEASLVKNWLSFVTSAEGQQAAADGAGSAPISQKLSDQLEPIIDSIAS